MPIKRRKAKARAAPITIEAVEAFKTAVALEPIYHGCIRGTCLSEKDTAHCADCASYLDAHRVLCGLLNIPPWSMCPSDPDLDGDKPSYMVSNPGMCIADTWQPMKELRAELMALAKEKNR